MSDRSLGASSAGVALTLDPGAAASGVFHPETFTLDNTAHAVIGVREGGAQAMRFDVVRVPGEQSLRDYLNSGWMEGVEKASAEDLTINGFPAASAVAHGDQWQFKVYALRQSRQFTNLRRIESEVLVVLIELNDERCEGWVVPRLEDGACSAYRR